jgi:serine/threonine protein kinase
LPCRSDGGAVTAAAGIQWQNVRATPDLCTDAGSGSNRGNCIMANTGTKLENCAPLPEGAQIGAYRILQTLSSGGFSIVYLAYSEREEECVAIKEYMPASRARRRPGELVPYIGPEHLMPYKYGLAAFFEEARILAAIQHPNIVQVLELVRANETIYMVMQYIEGICLEKHILGHYVKGRIAVLPEDFIISVFARLLDGLQEVHGRKLLHLDLKPSNIFLQPDGVPTLFDFGAARRVAGRDSTSSIPMYTPGYAAPEAYERDGAVGAWTDIYSIGACLLACMSAKAPQEAGSRVREDLVPLALEILERPYSPKILTITKACLQLDPRARPQSAAQLHKWLLAR